MRNHSFKRLCLWLSLIATTVCGTSFAEEAALRNPSFEDDEVGRVPSGWMAVKASLDAGYRISISDSAQAGQRCALIEREATEKHNAFGNLMQRVVATPFRGQRVRLRAAVRASVQGEGNQAQMWLRVDRPAKNNQPQIGHFDNMGDRPIIAKEWRHYDIVADVADDAQFLSLGVFLLGSGKAWIDDVTLDIVGKDVPVTGRELPVRIPPAAPGLFEVQGEMEVLRVNQVAGKDSNTDNVPDDEVVLIPLPLAYRDQSPLTFEMTVVPPEAAGGVSFYEDKPTNFVAKLTLKNLKQHRTVSVKFQSLVLVQPSQFDSVPKSAMIVDEWPAEARQWLASTWCADSSHDRLQTLAKAIRAESDDVLTIIQKVQSEARTVFVNAKGHVTNLTAIEALDKVGSCTSCANVVAALLRACGVPARVLAGYPSWSGPLQTHYIVEAFVPGFGWYPVESTQLTSPWPNHQQVNVSIVPIEYEKQEVAKLRRHAAGGVPYLTLTEFPSGHALARGTINEKRGCDHVCHFLRPFDAPTGDWQQATRHARTQWTQGVKSQPQFDRSGKLRIGDAERVKAAMSLAELNGGL